MEYRNVVVLERHNAPGTYALRKTDARQMRIHDDKGRVVHRELVPSRQDVHEVYEYIDRYVKAAHYKRTGEWRESTRKWEDGIAPVAPARRISGKGLAFVGIGIAVLLFIVSGTIDNKNAERLPSHPTRPTTAWTA
jgi:hypothetical protein